MKITNLYPDSQTLVREVSNFLAEWNNNESFIWANTSGSTGQPKKVKLKKSSMLASAKMTGAFFGLKKNQNALLVLSPTYIAGKMMIVRAMHHGMNLYLGQVSSVPFKKLSVHIHFSAMIPTQVKELIRNNVSFDKIEHLIIGGAQIGYDLKSSLHDVSTKCYATFGMTETLSHIALAEIDENELMYECLPGVSVRSDEKGSMIIDAPNLLDSELKTNDIIEINEDGRFVWKGRTDFVINSGGIKLHPEEIENKLAPFIQSTFFISSESHAKFGEVAVLYIESSTPINLDTVFESLKKVERPKSVYYRNHFSYTASGKLNRLKSIE